MNHPSFFLPSALVLCLVSVVYSATVTAPVYITSPSLAGVNYLSNYYDSAGLFLVESVQTNAAVVTMDDTVLGVQDLTMQNPNNPTYPYFAFYNPSGADLVPPPSGGYASLEAYTSPSSTDPTAQTTIWILEADGQITATWVNTDGSSTGTLYILENPNTQEIYLTADIPSTEAALGISSLPVLTLWLGPPPATGGISGDPHFVGIKGEKYDVVAEPDKWFNIATTPDFQFNAFFKEACEDKHGMTAITSIAMKFAGGFTFLVNNTGLGHLGDVALNTSPWISPYLIGTDGVYGKISHPWYNYFKIETSEFTIVLNRQMVDYSVQKPGMVYYGSNCLAGYFNIEFQDLRLTSPIHGLLGQTAHHVHKGIHVSNGDEGQGEIQGTYKDYLVSGPFGTDFKYNLFAL